MAPAPGPKWRKNVIMKVMKFGGTSVGSAERIKHVASLITRGGNAGQTGEDDTRVVVLSAMAGTTNTLVEIADYLSKGNCPGAQETLNALELKYSAVIGELLDTESGREKARRETGNSFGLIRNIIDGDFSSVEEKEILAQGELMSVSLMMCWLEEQGIAATRLPALEYMRIDEQTGEPDVKYIDSRLERLIDLAPGGKIYITEGYICRNSRGNIDNLRRGGSDYSASLIGASLGADVIEIWTDIDGMHNNDPRFVERTSPVSELNFEEAAELAYFGAKILHPNCVLPAKLNNIPVRLLNTLEPSAPGTLIYNRPSDCRIKAVAAKDNITAINIKSGRMLLAYGFLHRVFETFDKYHTGIDMMATSEVGVTVTVDNTDYLSQIVSDLKEFATVNIDTDMVIVCVVGDLEWHNSGIEAKAVSAVGDIPIRMISYGGSNFNISMLIDRKNKVEALNRLSDKLFYEQ